MTVLRPAQAKKAAAGTPELHRKRSRVKLHDPADRVLALLARRSLIVRIRHRGHDQVRVFAAVPDPGEAEDRNIVSETCVGVRLIHRVTS